MGCVCKVDSKSSNNYPTLVCNSSFSFVTLFNACNSVSRLRHSFCFQTSSMDFVGPSAFLANFPRVLYILRLISDVPRLLLDALGCILVRSESIDLFLVYNGPGARIFIRATYLLNVDSPPERSLPCITTSRASPRLAIQTAQRFSKVLPEDVLSYMHGGISLL